MERLFYNVRALAFGKTLSPVQRIFSIVMEADWQLNLPRFSSLFRRLRVSV